jgi:hypothetical protein
MKRKLYPLTILLGAVILSACLPSLVPPTEEPQPVATMAAQTNEKLMTLLVKQLTPAATSTGTATLTLPHPSNTPIPLPSATENATESAGTSLQNPNIKNSSGAVSASQNCLASSFQGIIGMKWDGGRKAWVWETRSFAPFTVTFSIRNSGTCPWDPAFRLGFYSGEHMSGPNYVLIGVTAKPNDSIQVDIGPLMTASTGYHSSYWKMQSADGTQFGPSMLLYVRVIDTIEPTPSPTPP